MTMPPIDPNDPNASIPLPLVLALTDASDAQADTALESDLPAVLARRVADHHAFAAALRAQLGDKQFIEAVDAATKERRAAREECERDARSTARSIFDEPHVGDLVDFAVGEAERNQRENADECEYLNVLEPRHTKLLWVAAFLGEVIALTGGHP